MLKYDKDTKLMYCDMLDISNSKMVENACSFLDKGQKIQAFSVGKKIPTTNAKITFMGKLSDQIGKGVVLYGYKPISGKCVIDIR